MSNQIQTKGIETNSKNWSITYNAKFTLSFCIIAFVTVILNLVFGGLINQSFALNPNIQIREIYRLLTYVFCHGNFDHLLGNFFYLLMLGPILEEKYGAKLLTIMTVITAIVTGLLNALLFNNGIIGASGIVFMFIILSSIVNMRSKEIPLTFIFIVVIYLGKEVYNSFSADDISQFAHIFGGLCGGALGFLFNTNKS
ncbi:MAG: rhomboid family intramembrane serine protease [Bacteroidetes bacterium]|nr:MAG: rhomboid family intramembrane serine protease [Bacteroidota bacterium]